MTLLSCLERRIAKNDISRLVRLDAAAMHMPAVFLRSLKATCAAWSCYVFCVRTAFSFSARGAAAAGRAISHETRKGRGWVGTLTVCCCLSGKSRVCCGFCRPLPPVPVADVVDQTELIEARSIAQSWLLEEHPGPESDAKPCTPWFSSLGVRRCTADM